MTGWSQFDKGHSIGLTGSEDGVILRDEEHVDGARVTLERVNIDRFTATCGIYGWMVHTRFFDSERNGLTGFEETKLELTNILRLIPFEVQANEGAMNAVETAIADFIDRCQ